MRELGTSIKGGVATTFQYSLPIPCSSDLIKYAYSRCVVCTVSCWPLPSNQVESFYRQITDYEIGVVDLRVG